MGDRYLATRHPRPRRHRHRLLVRARAALRRLLAHLPWRSPCGGVPVPPAAPGVGPRSPPGLLVVAPMTRRPSPAEAHRLADHHFVDRYDRTQLTALDRLDQLDRAATPLVVPFHTSRV